MCVEKWKVYKHKGVKEMKVKRIMAGILASILIIGQTVYAGETLNMDTENTSGIEENIQDEIVDNVEQDIESPEVTETVEGNESTENTDIENEEANNTEVFPEMQEEGSVSGKEYNSVADSSELTLYMNYPRCLSVDVWNDMHDKNQNDYEWRLVTENENICYGELTEYDGWQFYITVDAKSEGTTKMSLQYKGKQAKQYTEYVTYDVTVKPFPSDGVLMKDRALISKMVPSYDANGDGYISKTEMASEVCLYLYNFDYDERKETSIQNLSGLEYAENLEYIDIGHNKNLKDITPLLGLKKLKTARLRSTNVSLEDRIQLGRIPDKIVIGKGEEWCPEVMGVLEDVTLSSDDNLSLEYTPYDTVIGLSAGETVLRFTLGTQTKDVNLTVEDIIANQPVGNIKDITKTYYDTQTGKLLDSNGNLWKIGSEIEKCGENILRYYSCDVYALVYKPEWGEKKIEYVLDSNHILRDNEKILAEDVVKFDERYALNSSNILSDIFTAGTLNMDNVRDWQLYADYDGPGCYVLKNDGTLWFRYDVRQGDAVNAFEQIDIGVCSLSDDGYIKNGEFVKYVDRGYGYRYEGITNIEQVIYTKVGTDGYYDESDGYYGTDGYIYLRVDVDGNSSYVPIGRTEEIGEIAFIGHSFYGDETNYHIILTTSGTLYRCAKENNSLTLKKCGENIEWYSNDYSRTREGIYLDRNGNPVNLKRESRYFLRIGILVIKKPYI